jgi:glucose/arabinose dehydrogenase
MRTHARIQLLALLVGATTMPATAPGQSLLDPALEISVYISPEFLTSPTFFAFLPKDSPNDPEDVLITGGTGTIWYYRDGVFQGVAIDLPIAYLNERGLFGIAVHPDFPESSYVYVQHSSTTTGMDSSNPADVQDNRVVRMEWDPNTGTLGPPQLILLLPAFPGPNHNGGVVLVGPDRKLYGSIGDLNNNGQLQNIPTGPPPDDRGMLYRVGLDGTPSPDNPFFGVGGPIQKVYAYGTRNCFGMDFDPLTDILWMTDNGPASYDEINLVMPGTNLGWKEIGGPASRSTGSVDSLWMAPGAEYSDPEFSWLESFGVTSIHFIRGPALGQNYKYDCLVAAHNSRDIYHFEVNPDRMSLVMPDSSLADFVSDSAAERDLFLWAADVGVVTDIETGPDGAVYVCSSSNALIYRIAALTQTDVDPPPASQLARLHPAVPNPFNPSTALGYELAQPARTHIAVYDLSGRLVRVLRSSGSQDPGTHCVTWDGRDATGRSVASGAYVVRLSAGGASASRKVVLVR